MNERKTIKYCMVPLCKNTTKTTPNKIFITLPRDQKLRKQWQIAMRRKSFLGPKTMKFCCEDHFNLEEDMENYIYFKMMEKVNIRIKPGIVPHIFDCQPDRKLKHKSQPRQTYLKRKRQNDLEALLGGTSMKIGDKESEHDDEDRKIHENNQHSSKSTDNDDDKKTIGDNNYNQQLHNNNLCTENNNQALVSFIKNEIDIDETCSKIEKHSDNGDEKIYENNQHSNICIDYDNNKEIIDNCESGDCTKFNQQSSHNIKTELNIEELWIKTEHNSDIEDERIYESDQHSNTSDIKVFPSKIDTNSNENIPKDNSYLNKSDGSDENETIKNDNIQCNICKKKFKRKRYLRKHLLTHTGKKPYQCNICDKNFTFKGGLTKHLLTHTGEKPFQCDICKRKFTDKTAFTTHTNIHTGDKPYHCNICDKKFRFKDSLKRHALFHTGEKPYQCNICDKKFADKCALSAHINIHSGEKPHQCNICDKKFTMKQQLKQHLYTHTDDKPYQCNICNKKFQRKSYLKQHLSTHTDVGEFQCNLCDKKFTSNRRLNVHLSVHTGEKSPFQCNVCNKIFSRKYSLQKHTLERHTDREKNYQCNVCQKKFTRKGNLKTHSLRHTSDNNTVIN